MFDTQMCFNTSQQLIIQLITHFPSVEEEQEQENSWIKNIVQLVKKKKRANDENAIVHYLLLLDQCQSVPE